MYIHIYYIYMGCIYIHGIYIGVMCIWSVYIPIMSRLDRYMPIHNGSPVSVYVFVPSVTFVWEVSINISIYGERVADIYIICGGGKTGHVFVTLCTAKTIFLAKIVGNLH